MQKKDFTIHPILKRGPLFEWNDKEKDNEQDGDVEIVDIHE